MSFVRVTLRDEKLMSDPAVCAWIKEVECVVEERLTEHLVALLLYGRAEIK